MKTTDFTITQTIPAPPEKVYQALLDPKLHTDFTGSLSTGGMNVGDKFTAWDGYIMGKHLKLTPSSFMQQEWSTTEWPADYPPSIVEWHFKKVPGGTELTLKHRKAPISQVDDYKQGWEDFYFQPLKAYFSKK